MAGRPTKYDPSYDEAVVDFMAKGYSLTAFAGSILVAKQTINNWMDEHPSFLDAVNIGKAARTTQLEIGLLGEEVGPKVTARIFALKNAAPDEWKDKRETEHSGMIRYSDLSEEEIDQRIVTHHERLALPAPSVD